MGSFIRERGHLLDKYCRVIHRLFHMDFILLWCHNIQLCNQSDETLFFLCTDCPADAAQVAATSRNCAASCSTDDDCRKRRQCVCDDICGLTCLPVCKYLSVLSKNETCCNYRSKARWMTLCKNRNKQPKRIIIYIIQFFCFSKLTMIHGKIHQGVKYI